jgi:glyoxylase-like metal-dependent hydrolase (beta-lactamase superfamily II)
MRQLTPRVYGILKYRSLLNAYLIRNGSSLTLVDTGITGFAADIEKGLNALGANWSDIKTIFLTHAHVDHAGDLANIQKKTNATTLVHRLDAPIARGEKPVLLPDPSTLPFFSRMMQRAMGGGTFPPARVDRELNGDETLDEIAPGAKVIPVPGHTFGQVGIWLPDESTLIAGDMVFNYPLGGLRMPLRPPTVDWALAKKTIKQTSQMDIKNLMVGHGVPLIGDASEKLRTFAATLS